MDQSAQTEHQHHPAGDQPITSANGMPDFPAAQGHGDPTPGLKQHMDIDLPLLGVIVAASAMLTFVIIIGTQAWYDYLMQKETEVKSYQVHNTQLEDLKRDELSHINSYRWLDNKHQLVAIPIERAMELTMADYQKRQASPDNNATE